ncbi:hypothetical protein ACTMTI_06760 [Nonomuraea sp. H19]|uniref:hypothetical protein n=1 Tax=Nonomuraea sp. H19 TaxID=3452206 RepID=UPI003F8C9FB4
MRVRLSRSAATSAATRHDPYAAVSTPAERLEPATDSDEQLLAVATILAEAFRLDYVRMEIERPNGDRSVVEHGTPRGPSVSLPVAYRGESRPRRGHRPGPRRRARTLT